METEFIGNDGKGFSMWQVGGDVCGMVTFRVHNGRMASVVSFAVGAARYEAEYRPDAQYPGETEPLIRTVVDG